MINIVARDFAGIEKADLAVSGIALIAGLNGAGKSSLLWGIAGTVAGAPLPPGVTKKEAHQVVRAGAKAGMLSVANAEGTLSTAWPAGETKVTGRPIRCTPIAAGLVSIVDMPEREKAATLIEYLKASPTKGEFHSACSAEGVGIGEAQTERLWNLIEVSGWEPTLKGLLDEGTIAKRKWEEVAGVKYGTAKSAMWRPVDWSTDLEGADADTLAREMLSASTAHSDAQRNQAVSAAEIDRLKSEADKLEAATDEAAAAASARTAAREVAAKTQRALDDNPAPAAAGEARPDVHCPACKTALRLSKDGKTGGVIAREFKEPSAAETKKLADAHNKALLNHQGPAADLSKAEARVTRAEAALAAARKASVDLAEAQKKTGGADPEIARAKAELATKRVKMFRDNEKARDAHKMVMYCIAAAAIVAPEGLRRKKLTEAIDGFNERFLAPLCDSAGWAKVELREDMAFSYGGRIALLSESERWRIRAVLQLACAMIDQSGLVVIDRADVLDGPGRNGLFGAILTAALPAIVGMTIDKPKLVPDLTAAGVGSSWWIDGGVCKPLADAPAEGGTD